MVITILGLTWVAKSFVMAIFATFCIIVIVISNFAIVAFTAEQISNSNTLAIASAVGGLSI